MIVLEKKAGDLCCPMPWPNGPIRCRGAKCAGWGWQGLMGEDELHGAYGYCRMGSAPQSLLTPELIYPGPHWATEFPPSRSRKTGRPVEFDDEPF